MSQKVSWTQWTIALQAYTFEIIHRPGLSHQNADCFSQLPTNAALSPVANCLYDLILVPNLWSNEPQEIQKVLRKLSKDVTTANNQLYKQINGVKLPFV